MKKNSESVPVPALGGKLLYLSLRRKLSRLMDYLFIIAVWDKKLFLHWLRYIILPVVMMPNLAKALQWLAGLRHQSVEELMQSIPNFLARIVEVLAQVYVWSFQTGVLEFIKLLFALGFLRILMNLSHRERKLHSKITKMRVAGAFLDIFFLFNAIHYLYQPTRLLFKILVSGLFVQNILLLIALRYHHKTKGIYDPDRDWKREDRKHRRLLKEMAFKMSKAKKEHGRR